MKRKNKILNLVECALAVAIAIALELIPFPDIWAYGGAVSLCMIPIVFCSYRNGALWGMGAGFVLACVQMMIEPAFPPAENIGAVILCILLDYFIAFTALGSADFFAKLCGKYKSVGYAFGAICAGALRFVCSFISGIVLWGSYTPEGMKVWVYSLLYNGGYMLPNTIIAAIVLTAFGTCIDPKTLKHVKRNKA